MASPPLCPRQSLVLTDVKGGLVPYVVRDVTAFYGTRGEVWHA